MTEPKEKEPHGREWFKKAIAKMLAEPPRIDPNIFIISPTWNEGIENGTLDCPCHGDKRHKLK